LWGPQQRDALAVLFSRHRLVGRGKASGFFLACLQQGGATPNVSASGQVSRGRKRFFVMAVNFPHACPLIEPTARDI
jgi:hypothetical protein